MHCFPPFQPPAVECGILGCEGKGRWGGGGRRDISLEQLLDHGSVSPQAGMRATMFGVLSQLFFPRLSVNDRWKDWEIDGSPLVLLEWAVFGVNAARQRVEIVAVRSSYPEPQNDLPLLLLTAVYMGFSCAPLSLPWAHRPVCYLRISPLSSALTPTGAPPCLVIMGVSSRKACSAAVFAGWDFLSNVTHHHPVRTYPLLSQMKPAKPAALLLPRQKAHAQTLQGLETFKTTSPSSTDGGLISNSPSDRAAFNLDSDLQCVSCLFLPLSCLPATPVAQWVGRQCLLLQDVVLVGSKMCVLST
jgi:hypothetical protein